MWLALLVGACGSTQEVAAAPPGGGSAKATPVPSARAALVKAVGARASSALGPYKGYTFGPDNLIDGRVDTSWQPVGKTTLGVGQWVELDLGAPHEVSALELVLGLQVTDPKLGDLFCRNTRPAAVRMVFDDGATGLLWSPSGSEKSVSAPPHGELTRRGVKVDSVRTRRIRLVIDLVEQPVDWKDVALAEVRVYGSPVAESEVPPPGGACGTSGYVPFLNAVIEHCAVLSTKDRARSGCKGLVHAFSTCTASGPFKVGQVPDKVPMPPIDEGAAASGRVTVPAGSQRVGFALGPSGWRVDKLDPEPSGRKLPEALVRMDEDRSNHCWEALGKARPNEDLPPEPPDFGANPDFDVD
jgi:hypothetical protein